MININQLRLIKDLQTFSDKHKYNIKVTYQFHDDILIVVFEHKDMKMGLRYDKIDHLQLRDIVDYAAGQFEANVSMFHIKEIFDEMKSSKFYEDEDVKKLLEKEELKKQRRREELKNANIRRNPANIRR